MAIYRGPGGTGDAVNDASSEALITVQAKDAAIAAQVAAEAARDAAQLAETNAETAETNAETAETNAETAATNAANSASAASTSASNAASSASAASTSASNASTSATNAANSASAASTSASNAASSASTASIQATNASNSASAAATSATNASNSASAAATSATNAANSATAAQTARTAAELAETNAETAETNAETAETNAAASASAAATSASNASTSASNAATSATNASNSASAAATSATNASNSASAAATSATNASNSASAAATSATNAAASYDSFDDRYLGAKSSAPTLDNDGNTLLVGALYFNTTTNEMKVWDGSTWLNAYVSLSGALLSTNNLSDLNNTATARTNLGVAIGVNVQAYDAQLADIAGLTPTDNNFIVGNGTNFVTESGSTVRTSLGLGSIATQDANNVAVTGGSINGTTVGASTAASGAFTSLTSSSTTTLNGTTIPASKTLVVTTDIGSTVQAYDAQLADVAGLTPADNNFIVGNGTNFVTESGSTARTSLGLGSIATQDANNVAVTGGSINGTTVGASTPSTGSFTSLTDSGNLNFTGTGNRIIGDFSNATAANRVGFQSNTTNGQTAVIAVPNGTSTTAQWQAYNNSDPTNSSFLGLAAVGTTDVRISSGIVGTGSYLPITFYNGGSERLRIDTSGNVGIGTSTISERLIVRQDQNAQSRITLSNQDSGSSAESSLRLSSFGGSWDIANGSAARNSNALTFSQVGGSERMRIDSSGNVGIGTSSPAANLDVRATGAAANLIVSSNISTSALASRISLGNSTGANRLTMGLLGTAGETAFLGSEGNFPIYFQTNGTERMRITSGGQLRTTVTGTTLMDEYGCRAWVNFNGTGTVAIRGSGNVSSITDNGVGDYTVNFTTAMPDTNYSVVGSCGRNADKNIYVLSSKTNNTSSAFVYTNNASGGILYTNQYGDWEFVSVAIFR